MDAPPHGNRRDPARREAPERAREARIAVGVGVATVAGLVLIAVAGHGQASDDGSAADRPTGSLAPAVLATTTVPATGDETLPDLVGEAPAAAATFDPETCEVAEESMRLGDTGDDIRCLQAALADAGLYTGEPSGSFDNATYNAVMSYQESEHLFVDGVAGRETGLSLGIWPEEPSQVVHTPPPPAGAMDSMGFALSSVASTGADAPPLPEGSGEGRRVVYQRAGQRVWAVDDNEQIIRSWLVSGSQYNNEAPGTHHVYSKSEESTAWNFKAKLPLMIRYQQTAIGHIGFHAIPLSAADGTPYQTEAELGQRLSGGCQRQANLDAQFLWYFADIGTKVVVI